MGVEGVQDRVMLVVFLQAAHSCQCALLSVQTFAKRHDAWQPVVKVLRLPPHLCQADAARVVLALLVEANAAEERGGGHLLHRPDQALHAVVLVVVALQR